MGSASISLDQMMREHGISLDELPKKRWLNCVTLLSNLWLSVEAAARTSDTTLVKERVELCDEVLKAYASGNLLFLPSRDVGLVRRRDVLMCRMVALRASISGWLIVFPSELQLVRSWVNVRTRDIHVVLQAMEEIAARCE